MFILGSFTLGAAPGHYLTPFTNIEGINSLQIQNALFDELFVTKDLTFTPLSSYPASWTQATVLHGKYEEGNLSIGNIDFAVNNTTDIVVKRREKGSFTWQNIFHKKIEDTADFEFSFYDRYARSGTAYEYGMSQIYGNIEGNVVISEAFSQFDGYFLMEKEQLFHLMLNLTMERQKNAPRAYLAGLNKKYPSTVITSKANYYTGSASAVLFEYQPELCGFCTEDAWAYRDQFMEFLTNGKPKVMKSFTGQIYLINVDNGPADSSSDHWNLPGTSFSWIQVGDASSTDDLAQNGLLDLDYEWWSV